MSAIGQLTSTVRETTRRFFGGRGLLLAGSLAFSFVLCLAPLILLLLSAVGFLLTGEQVSEYVLNAGASLLPRYGQEMVGIVSTLLRERRVNGLFGAIALALVATQLFSLTRTVVNVAFGVRRRGLVRGLAFALLGLAVLGVVAVVAASAIVTAVALRDVARLGYPRPPNPSRCGLGRRRSCSSMRPSSPCSSSFIERSPIRPSRPGRPPAPPRWWCYSGKPRAMASACT